MVSTLFHKTTAALFYVRMIFVCVLGLKSLKNTSLNKEFPEGRGCAVFLSVPMVSTAGT